MESLNKMRGVTSSDAAEKQAAEISKFRLFYVTDYYKEFKEGIEEQLNALDRQRVTDPGQLVLIQGQRNAYITILDGLNQKERRVNDLMRVE